jgi:hypothetical protein
MTINVPSTEATGQPIMLLTHTRACSTAFERVLEPKREKKAEDTLTSLGLHDSP